MKKLAVFTSFIAVVLTFSPAAFANSGPVFWQGYPSSMVMAIEENSPIRVESEELTFDFSEASPYDHTISGQVTAVYEMANPTEEARVVQMAFPFVGILASLAADPAYITADGRPLPYDIYIGDAVASHGAPGAGNGAAGFSFAAIVGTITDAPYEAANFAGDEKGKLYTIDVRPTTDAPVNCAVDFTFDREKTKIITDGFNRHERDGEKIRVAAWCYGPETLEILVLGEEVDLNIEAYSDGGLERATDLYEHETAARTVEVKDYLRELIAKRPERENAGAVSAGQIENLYTRSLDEALERNLGYCYSEDLFAPEYFPRLLTFVYTVDFPPQGDKTVSVRYPASGTMDRRETAKPLYTFDYILNPAANWSSFGSLNVKVLPPPPVPYIVNSSIEFAKEDNNAYNAVLAELPENDLSFTLYASEKITLTDKFAGSMRRRFGLFAPFVTGAGLLLAACGVLAAVRKRRILG